MINISDLIFRGCYKNLKLGNYFNTLSHNSSAIDRYFNNGEPIGHNVIIDNISFDIGNDQNGNIIYVILKIYKQKENMYIVIKDKKYIVNAIRFKDIIEILNTNNVSWKFEGCYDQIIRINVLESAVDFVFSFYDNDDHLQVIEMVDKERYQEIFSGF